MFPERKFFHLWCDDGDGDGRLMMMQMSVSIDKVDKGDVNDGGDR